MSDKLKNFIIRTLSGIVMVATLIGATLFSKLTFVLLLLAITLGGEWEFYRLAKKAGTSPQRFVGMLAGTMMIVAAAAALHEILAITVVAMVAFMILIPMPLIFELYRKSATPMANVGITYAGVIYVALPMALLTFFPMMLGNGEWKPWSVILYIFIIWANDVFAYLFGITLGKHRLFERISPKKSWEGFFGGLLGAMAMGFVAAKVLDANVALWIGLALIAAITGVFGDLVESLLKRSVDVKDSGSFIPGHGGWLDRFDALIFSVPFAFIYLVIVEFI
jgi:phosphatidate cytidylyltransferase